AEVGRTRVVEVHVARSIVRLAAAIGGEGNGGVMYPPLHVGRDAPVAAALLLTLLTREGEGGGRRVSQLVAAAPRYVIVKAKVPRGPALERAYAALRRRFADAEADTQDGLRLAWRARWLHLRPSNTAPHIQLPGAAPTTLNAHPHTDCGGTLALIHNGIIENAGALRTALGKRGHVFRSETDTEVLAHLVEELLSAGSPLVEAVAGALHQVEGTYGIAVVSSREPDTIVAARHGPPLLVAIGTGENFVASDASAVLAHTRSVVYLDDGEIAVVRPQDYRILDLETVEKEKAVTRVDWDLATIERGGHAHFMLKEILEQPESVRNTLRGRLLEEDGTARLGGLNIDDEQLLQVNRIVFTACGTSW